MKPGQSLLITELATLGEAYEAIQKLPDGVEVFELIPGGEGATLLVQGPPGALQGLFPRAAGRVVQPSEKIIKAYLGLAAQPLKKYFGCFESQKVAEVFEAATRLEKAGWQVLDLRILRGSFPKTSLLATIEDSTTVELKDLQGVWTQIKEPGEKLRAFFEI